MTVQRSIDGEASEKQILATCKKGMQMKSDVRSLTKKILGRRVFLTVATLAILSVMAIGTLQAKGPPPSLTFSISDLQGDQRGTIDITRMDMNWKPNNGKYTIVLTADMAHPFTGQFRVNINVYDPSAPSQSSLFSDTLNDYNLGSTTTTTLTLTGSDPTLKHWNAGDQVATHSLGLNNGPLGNPPGVSLFRSSVSNHLTFLADEDVIGVNDQSWNGLYMTDPSGTATIAVGP
jgi:hypothetical protein